MNAGIGLMTLSEREELVQESCQGLHQSSTGVITRIISVKTVIVFPSVQDCSSNIFYLMLSFNCRNLRCLPG